MPDNITKRSEKGIRQASLLSEEYVKSFKICVGPS